MGVSDSSLGKPSLQALCVCTSVASRMMSTKYHINLLCQHVEKNGPQNQNQTHSEEEEKEKERERAREK